MSGVTVAGSTSDPGPWAYQFSSPTAMIFDQYGYMYVLDCGNNRVQKWLPGASYGVTVVSSSFNNPYGMQMDRLNNIMVADCYNHRVAVFGILCRKFFCCLSLVITPSIVLHFISAASTTTTTAAPSQCSDLRFITMHLFLCSIGGSTSLFHSGLESDWQCCCWYNRNARLNSHFTLQSI